MNLAEKEILNECRLITLEELHKFAGIINKDYRDIVERVWKRQPIKSCDEIISDLKSYIMTLEMLVARDVLSLKENVTYDSVIKDLNNIIEKYEGE